MERRGPSEESDHKCGSGSLCALGSDSDFDFEEEHGTKVVDSEDVGQKCEADHLPLVGTKCDGEANKNGDICN